MIDANRHRWPKVECTACGKLIKVDPGDTRVLIEPHQCIDDRRDEGET